MSALFQTIRFKECPNWSVSHLMESQFNYNQEYELVRIGNFVTRNKTQIIVQDDVEYKRVTIKLYNKGIVLRDKIYGKDIGTKKQYLIKEGQFLLSKIDARNGAFGLAIPEVDGAIITADFFAYDIDTTKIEPLFLVLMTTTKKFMQFAQSASSGTTGRQRIDEKKFLDVKIPLPSLQKQKEIVGAYQKKTDLANEQEEKVKIKEREIEEYFSQKIHLVKKNPETTKSTNILEFLSYMDFDRWGISYLKKKVSSYFKSAIYDTQKVHTLLKKISGGKTPSKSNQLYWEGSISWASPKDFNGICIEKTEDHISDLAVKKAGMTIFPKGTILIVFRSGILRHTIPISITTIETTINQDLKALQLDQNQIIPLYFVYFISIYQNIILDLISKKGATVESIETADFLELAIPLPSLKIQNEISDHIAKEKDEIDALKKKANENRLLALQEFEKEIFDEN